MKRVTLTTEELHRLHDIQLEMLCEFDRICKTLGVAYQLAAGSLLGAVRHSGFIPWDDDIDVVMLRSDYHRFLRQAPQLLDQRFFLQTWHSDRAFPLYFAKLRRQGSIFREEFWQHCPQHHGIFIDIFPFDPAWPECRSWRGLLVLLRLLVRLNHRADSPFGAWQTAWRSVGRRLHDGLLAMLARVPSQQVVFLASVGGLEGNHWRTTIRSIGEFRRTVHLRFEDWTFPVTADYHTALTRLYGDYMVLPKPDQRIPGHSIVEFRLPSMEAHASIQATPSGLFF